MRLPTRKSETLAQTMKVHDDFPTPAKILRMREEIVDLEQRQRPVAAEELRRCAAMGDLSENAAYSYAKFELRRINNRITSLEQRLATAIPIDQSESADGRVRIGSRVTVESSNGRTSVLEVVGSQEANPLRGRISYLSPIGKSLIGHEAGDRVAYESPAGRIEYVIVAVE